MIRTERTFGGGTHRVVTISEECPMAESARFLARQEGALLRAEGAAEIEDFDQRLAELSRAIGDFLRA